MTITKAHLIYSQVFHKNCEKVVQDHLQSRRMAIFPADQFKCRIFCGVLSALRKFSPEGLSGNSGGSLFRLPG